MNTIDIAFIAQVEKDYFRTDEDIGANGNTLLVWNLVRKHVGLAPIQKGDLPSACKTHDCYHVIRGDYGCERMKPN